MSIPRNIFKIGPLPHDWLFPRVVAAVHHGGAGTTGATLRAGIPSVVVPYFVDQPFWARKLEVLGVAPPPIPRPELTAQRLGDAISQTVKDQDMKDRAAALGEKVRRENGVQKAVDVIEQHMRYR